MCARVAVFAVIFLAMAVDGFAFQRSAGRRGNWAKVRGRNSIVSLRSANVGGAFRNSPGIPPALERKLGKKTNLFRRGRLTGDVKTRLSMQKLNKYQYRNSHSKNFGIPSVNPGRQR
jgi:hypothetical protein